MDYGDCSVDEIKTGEIKWMYNGLGMIWVRCPISAANNVVKEGRIKIGWTVARVELLAKRPLQCYKCWEFGHVRFSCNAEVERKGSCYNCGAQGHTVGTCSSEKPRCVICEKRGFSTNHRIGSRFCRASKETERTTQLPRRRIVEEKTVGKTEIAEENKEERAEDKEGERMEYTDEI